MPKPDYPPPGSIVLLTWQDAAQRGPYWVDKAKAKAHAPVKVQTVGFLVKASKRRVTIMQSFHRDQVGGVFSIPAAWVVQVTTLNRGKDA